MEPAGKHQGVEVGGAVDLGIRVLDPHVAEPYDGFKTPLEVLSHPEHDAGLNAEVKIFVFLQPVARMIRIRIDVVRVLIEDIRYVRPEAEDNAEMIGVQMIAQGQEGIGTGQQVGVAADTEHADEAARLRTEAGARHQRPVAAQACVQTVGQAQSGSQHRKMESVLIEIKDFVIPVASGLEKGAGIESNIVLDTFPVPETIPLRRQESKGQQYGAGA